MNARARAVAARALTGAALGASLPVAIDVCATPICLRLPLVAYLGAAALGAAIAVAYAPRSRARGGFGRGGFGRGAAVVIAAGVAGAAWLGFQPMLGGSGRPSKCAWRTCDRVLGPAPLRSPFPVTTPDCQTLDRCANEYPFSASEHEELARLSRAHGCTAP